MRLPVGYWIIAPEKPYKGGIRYVDWAFRMAEKYQLQVLLDLHGAPGSQNSNDHSGRAGETGWFDDAAGEQTAKIIKKLYERYKKSPAFWGIELLNEPDSKRHFAPVLRKFYKTTAGAFTGDTRIVFHDSYRPRRWSGALKTDQRAVMDVHLYHMSSWLARCLSAGQFVWLTKWCYGRLLRKLTKKQPVVIGEWSIVLKGEKLRKLSGTDAEGLMRRFGTKQLAAYEQHAAGWFYWNYTTEESGLWNFRWLVDSKILVIPH